MQRYIILIGLSLGLVVPFAVQAGGGWTQNQGGGFLKLSGYFVRADQHFTANGGLDPNATYQYGNLNLFGEYGLNDRWTLQAYLPFFARATYHNQISATTGEVILPGDAINGLGDIDLTLKYGLIKNKPWVLAASLTLGLPTGISSGGANGSLQTGDGEFNQMLRLHLSRGFRLGPASSWVSFTAGVNNRTRGFSDEFRYGVEWGSQWFERRLLVVLRLHGYESFQNSTSREAINSTSLFANNAELLGFSPEIGWKLNDQWGISATLGTALFGRLIFANPAYSVGIFTSW